MIVPDVPEDEGVDRAGRASDDVLAVHYPVRLVYRAALDHGVELGAERVVPDAGTAEVVNLERLQAAEAAGPTAPWPSSPPREAWMPFRSTNPRTARAAAGPDRRPCRIPC